MTSRVARPNLAGPVRELSEGWRAAATCATNDPDLMFPPDQEPTTSPAWQAAKAVCAACPVLTTCRAFYAAAGPDAVAYGVHAGLDPKDWAALVTASGTTVGAVEAPMAGAVQIAQAA